MPDTISITSTITDVPAKDSTVVDSSASTKAKVVNFLELKKCHDVDAPRVLRLKNVHLGRVAYAQGVEPEPLKALPGYDSGVMCMLVVIFLIIAVNCRHYTTFIKTFTTDLLSVRQRANAFDENPTVSETRVLLSLTILLCACEGILLYSAIAMQGYAPDAFRTIGILSLLAAGYYGWQLLAYRMVGYLFSNEIGKVQWIKGFNTSQSLLGLFMAVPAMVVLFNPGLTPLLLIISAVLYATARIIFISKGFRIFYNNYSSLVYFILYLCTLEIIPPIILYRIALSLTITY